MLEAYINIVPFSLQPVFESTDMNRRYNQLVYNYSNNNFQLECSVLPSIRYEPQQTMLKCCTCLLNSNAYMPNYNQCSPFELWQNNNDDKTMTKLAITGNHISNTRQQCLILTARQQTALTKSLLSSSFFSFC